MTAITAWLKAWWLPGLRAFLGGALAALVAGLANVTSVPALWTLVCGAAFAGGNAVILLLQTATPGLPNPVAPTVVPKPAPVVAMPVPAEVPVAQPVVATDPFAAPVPPTS